jgi:hypothetical protein
MYCMLYYHVAKITEVHLGYLTVQCDSLIIQCFKIALQCVWSVT